MDFPIAVITPVKSRWDKCKAIQETVDDMRVVEAQYCRVAGKCLAKVYSLKKINKDLPPGVENEFYEMVHETAERALSPKDGE